ncbi:DUF4124 domain-containing protein [Glaciecola sp. 33A]|jgi:hypothetical protein|uniref:DUF4124 domain-containing protein n=1 Tax=Glaciecola sp. 33A TaxID=2057807 RepID=UPI000C34DCAE|nr:DUF4124 domain-containing protein [Glaciecola sp. 33A]PKI00683.1 DUF4124 domain-containing protein [Glaciecola sp. 33A]
MNIVKCSTSKWFRLLIILGLALSSSAHAGKIYKTVNTDGTITYSDQPTPGAIEVDFASNTTTIVQNPNIQTKQLKTIKQKKPVEHALNVISPVIDGTIRNAMGNVTISASVTPNAPGHYELSLHEKKLRSTSGTFLIKDLPRGEYSYQINFVSTSGKVIASSSVRRFFMHKPSALIKPQNNSN